MRTFLLLVGVVAIPLPLPLKADEAPMPPEGWATFSPKDKTFTVWLPNMGGRRSERQRTIVLRGNRVRVNAVQLQMNDGRTLTAGSTIIPPLLARRIPAGELVEAFRDAHVEAVKGKIEGEMEIKQGPVSGKEYTISTNKGILRLRLYGIGGLIFEASVSGTKEQAESKQASDFLDSYRITRRVTDPGSFPPEDKLAGKGAKVIPGELFAYLQGNVKEKRVVDTEAKGFTLTKNLFREVPEKGGVLIGFNVGLKKFFNDDVIAALQPIYLTKEGDVTGEWIGPKPASVTTIKAKPGYVVGGINLRTGLTVNGFSLNFMKLAKDHLEVKDTYKSDWIGCEKGGPSVLGGHGYFFVGVHGHVNDQKTPCSLGLVIVLKPKE